MKQLCACSVILLVCLAELRFARADAIIVTKAMTASTIAEVFIEDGVIRVELEIGVQDLNGFRNLLPDELYERLGHAPQPFPERTRRFFAEDWIVRADGGEPLIGRIESVEPGHRIMRDEITGAVLPAQPDDAEVVVRVAWSYALATVPAVLSIRPPTGADTGFAAANIGFVVYHRGLPVNDFRYLGPRQTLELDWDDPWYTRFENRNLRRTYFAPMTGFIYVEPYEVRKEIIARPKDLQEWVDLGLAGRKTIPVEIQADLKRKAAAFLRQHHPVRIDGKTIEPEGSAFAVDGDGFTVEPHSAPYSSSETDGYGGNGTSADEEIGKASEAEG